LFFNGDGHLQKKQKNKEKKKKYRACWGSFMKNKKETWGGGEVQTLGEKPMFSTTSQLSFIIENITFNYKMFFAIKK
jgi:hypothetical protein